MKCKKETSSKCVTPERWHLWTVQFSTTHSFSFSVFVMFGLCVCVCREVLNWPCAGLRVWAGTGWKCMGM